MTSLIRVLFISFLLSGWVYAKNSEQSLDNIVAIVNDSIITQSELNQALRIAKTQMADEHLPPQPDNTLRKQILQHLINNKVQLETAESAGIHINDTEINKLIANIAKENGLSVSAFYERISQTGLTAESYRKQIRESMTVQRLQQQEIASRITIAPDEITEFMKSTQNLSPTNKEYHLEDIVVPLSDSPSPEEIAIAKKFAEDMSVKLQKGTSLQNLPPAETESLQINDLKFRQLAEIPTAFTDIVTRMQSHEFAAPIQTSNGFHIVHLLEVRKIAKDAKPTLEKKEVAQLIFQRKFEEAMQGWLAKIRGQAFIVIQDKAIA